MTSNFYVSLQYSAIQKTVLRHDRLWSMAGMSLLLAELNEIVLPNIAIENEGCPIVAGGGKFTARFVDDGSAKKARAAMIKAVATTLPMLEFQVSDIVAGNHFADKDDGTTGCKKDVLDQLSAQKSSFRGYGVSFNPHFACCPECGEYPAEFDGPGGKGRICRVCRSAANRAQIVLNEVCSRGVDANTLTTLERIYLLYLIDPECCPAGKIPEIPRNFENLFTDEEASEHRRMGIWMSDLNNMGDKVPIWLLQNEEQILKTFQQVTEKNIEIVAAALKRTFGRPGGSHLPFRLVVAGGDDLCVVMAERYVLDFALNFSSVLNETMKDLATDHPLHIDRLTELKRAGTTGEPGPYSFGGSFVVTSLHTPFRAIHAVGEELMGQAKRVTDRAGNSVNWRIMAESKSLTDTLLDFDKPLFVDPPEGSEKPRCLSFRDNTGLATKYGNTLSGTHVSMIVEQMIQRRGDPAGLDAFLRKQSTAGLPKSFEGLLKDRNFRDAEGTLLPARLAILFELMTIARE